MDLSIAHRRYAFSAPGTPSWGWWCRTFGILFSITGLRVTIWFTILFNGHYQLPDQVVWTDQDRALQGYVDLLLIDCHYCHPSPLLQQWRVEWQQWYQVLGELHTPHPHCYPHPLTGSRGGWTRQLRMSLQTGQQGCPPVDWGLHDVWWFS